MNEAVLHFYKAEDSPDLMLLFDQAFPEPRVDLPPRAVFIFNASNLEKALHSVLPGGTYEELLRRMLERRTSLSCASLGTTPKVPE